MNKEKVSVSAVNPLRGTSLKLLNPNLKTKLLLNEKIWLTCEVGHLFETTLFLTRRRNFTCLVCSDFKRDSKVSKDLFSFTHSILLPGVSLQQYFTLPYPVIGLKNPAFKVDGFIKPQSGLSPVVIEYDGYRWHAPVNSQLLDIRKTLVLLKNNHIVIRVRDKRLPKLNINHPNFFHITGDDKKSVYENIVLQADYSECLNKLNLAHQTSLSFNYMGCEGR